jgi:hypothetical protein
MDTKLTENTQIVENMDVWAHKLAEKIIAKEMQHIPHSVAALACVYFVQEMCDNNQSVFDRQTMAKILLGGKKYQNCD